MPVYLVKLGPGQTGFGEQVSCFTVLYAWDSMLGGFYLPLTSGQNYLLLTTR